jgi:hypothetical protein
MERPGDSGRLSKTISVAEREALKLQELKRPVGPQDPRRNTPW